MARGSFPGGDFGRATSGGLPGGNIGAPAAGAAAAVGDAARQFGRRVRDMADRAYVREGEADAARDIQSANETGVVPTLRPGRGVDDEAYNTATRSHLLTRRQAAYMEEMGAIETAHPDSETAWAEAAGAVRAAFRPTGDPQLDLEFDRFRTLQDAQTLGRVRGRQEETRRQVVRGAFVDAATLGRTTLGQAVASAGFSDDGASRVAEALTQFAGSVARFGPREAFSVGGVEFPADPTRAGVVSPQAIAELYGQVQAEARVAWIVQAGERAPDAAAKRAFAGQVQERWAAGDPMFAGLDAADMGRLSARLEGDAERAATDERAAVAAAGEQARELLRALEYGGDVDPAEIRAAAQASGDVGLIAEVDYRMTYGFQVSPREGGGATGGAIGGGFGPWVGVLLDQLEGPGLVTNDNGRGRAQFGITEASHPEAWRDGRVDRQEASAIYKREYWDAIGGDQLTPELAFAAASAAVVGGVGTARELLQQSGGDVDRFLSLEEARFRRLAADNPELYGDDLPGWLNRVGRVRGAVAGMRAQRRAAEGYATDPIGYARGTERRPALASIAEFDLDAVFAGGGGAAAWGQTLRDRRARGQELSRRDGVPPRMLSSEEVSYYKDSLERDPGNVVALAAAAYASVGPDGARDLFAELGRGGLASADLRLGWLATEPATRNVAARIVEGRRLRAEGGVAPVFETDERIADRAPQFARALTAQPQVLAAITALAEDMAYADMAVGRLQSADSYLQSALGATNRGDQRFGGMRNVNGAATIVPTWLDSERMDEALEIAAQGWTAADRGPVYANGAPIPARTLANYRLLALPSGRYRLINPSTGAQAVARNGSAFEFDIETPAFRDLLARRLPGAVLPEAR